MMDGFFSLDKKINELVNIGTICEVKDDSADENKSLGRVAIGDDYTTGFLPVLTLAANSVVKIFTPLVVGEQVVILSPAGDIDSGIIIGSIFNKKIKEPVATTGETVIEFGDGVIIRHKPNSKLEIKTPLKLEINCKVADITADAVKIDSSNIELGEDGAGVVTGECVCFYGRSSS
jgi:phage baseplate assembly protein V